VAKVNGVTTEEREVLESAISGQGGRRKPIDPEAPASEPDSRVVRASRPSDRIWDAFLRGNPSQFNQQIFSTLSTSTSLGQTLVNSRALYDLLDEMVIKDTTIAAVLNVIVAFVLQRPETMTIEDDEDPQAIEIRDACQAMILDNLSNDYDWNQLRHSLINGMLIHGFSVNEIIWDLDGEFISPRSYHHRHPGRFVFNEFGQLIISNGALTHSSDLFLRLLSRDRSPVDDNDVGNLAPERKFVLVRAPALYDNPYGQSAILNLRWDYVFKKDTKKALINYGEKYGTPLATITVPQEAADREAIADKAEDNFNNLGQDSAFILVDGEIVVFTPRASGVGKPVQIQIYELLSRDQARALIGGIMVIFEPEHASRAQSSVHEGVAQEIVKPLARIVERAINRDIIDPFVELNYGPDAPRPKYRIDTDEAEDREVLLKTVDTLFEVGVPLSEEQIREKTGFSVPKSPEDTIQKVQADPEGGSSHEDDDEPTEFAERSAPGVNVSLERESSNRIRTIAQIVSDANEKHLKKAFLDGLDRMARFGREAMPLPHDAFNLARFDFSTLTDELEESLSASWVVAALSNLRAFSVAVPGLMSEKAKVNDIVRREVFDEFGGAARLVMAREQLERLRATLKNTPPHEIAYHSFVETIPETVPSPFVPAFDWLKQRQVFTIDELAEAAQAARTINPALVEDFFQRDLRRQVFAISNSISRQAATKVRNYIADAVNEGKTLRSFLDEARELVDARTYPGGTRAYLENVFRTEQANAYGEQRDIQLADPDLAEHLWGFEFFNPMDSRSRDSHDAMDGVQVRRGSRAAQQTRPGPPWSYQCRCTKAPIIVADVQASELEESEDAMTKALAIERF